jgi:hypothetical protein
MGLKRDWILEPAVEALTITKIGRCMQDPQLIREGGQAYVKALNRVRASLSNKDTMIKDSTFAAVQVLSLHEVRLSIAVGSY